MKQQVNLLADHLRPRREQLTISQLLLGWTAFAGLLTLVATWDGIGIWQLSSKQAETREQWQLLKDANERLRGTFSTDPDAALAAEVAELKAEQLERLQLMKLLAEYQAQQAGGFSGYLDDLATYNVDGIWLSAISLQTGGRWIQLKGVTTDPAKVPEFLRRLSDGESFDGHLFDAFELKETDAGLLEFDIVGPEEGTG